MPKNIVDERNELLRLGRTTYQIPAQEKSPSHNIIDLTNQAVSAGQSLEFVSLEGLGYIKECLVVSPSTGFSVIVTVDGSQILNRTYTEYTDITQIVSDISAFEERDTDGNPLGKYVVHLANINFKNSLSLSVKNDSGGSITFQNLFCKYKTM